MHWTEMNWRPASRLLSRERDFRTSATRRRAGVRSRAIVTRTPAAGSRRTGHAVVHGWLNARGETFENRLRFHSHSIVRSAGGELLDITLSEGAPNYAFILHPFDDDHFRREIIGRIPTVDHLLGPDPVIPSEFYGEDPSLDNRFL